MEAHPDNTAIFRGARLSLQDGLPNRMCNQRLIRGPEDVYVRQRIWKLPAGTPSSVGPAGSVNDLKVCRDTCMHGVTCFICIRWPA